MKIAILADTHWGARGDSPIFHEYFSRFFREIFFPYIDDHGIKTVIHLGDLVDRRKFLTYTTANVMRREYIEPSSVRKLETHVIVGNHDCAHKNNNEVNALREVIMGRDGFTIYSNPAVVQFNRNFEARSCSYGDPLRALMLPWISPENEEKSIEALGYKNIDICFAHLELAGFEMARGQMMDHGMDSKPFAKFKAVYTGHYHHKSSKGNIHYLGAPYEMTWADCDDPKGFHVLDTDTGEIEFVLNPITLFKKIHVTANSEPRELLATKGKITKLIVHDLGKAGRKVFEQALAEVEAGTIDLQVIDEHLEVDTTAAHNIEIADAEDTMQIVKDFVMASDIDADKDALVGLLKQLYVEAQAG